MRISTNTIYAVGIANLQQQNAKLVQVQQQIGTGQRILTPADDPSGSARVLEVSQSQATNKQFEANMGAAVDSLSLEESVLASIADVLQNAKDAANSAGNGAFNASDRLTLASQLRGQYQELLGLANSTDSGGQYLFAGYQSATRPFSQSAPGVIAYNGDQGQRLMQVGPTRQIEVSDSGEALFRRIPAGNGNFFTQDARDAITGKPTNTGTALIDDGNTLDALKWNGAGNSKDFTIRFSVNSGSTTYDVIDNVSGNSLLTGLAPAGAPYPRAYSSGSAINLSQAGPPAFDFGAQLTISGIPANGDSFTVQASTSQDVFSTIGGLATLLESNVSTTARINGLTGLERNLDNALNNVIAARASVGTRLKELDSLKSSNEGLAFLYSQNLSQLQDLDYAKAASEFTQQQTALQAAQQSFVKIAGLSLFNYI